MLILGLPLGACPGERGAGVTESVEPITLSEEQLRQEVEAWKAEREARLRQPDGWLSLVGLEWLEEGSNTIGSAEGNQVLLPTSTPPHLGTLHLEQGAVRFETHEGLLVHIDGNEVSSSALASDASGAATEVRIGSVLFYLIARGDQIGVRVKDSEAETLLHFEGLDYYDLEPSWALSATFRPHDPPKSIPVPNVLGTVNETPSPGALEFQVDGTSHRLDVLDGGEGELFVLFSDQTNGSETYGAGRFLYTSTADEQGRVLLDFNRAYSPPCVFTPYATCPLPPSQNRLALAVTAGEKNYAGSAH